MKSELSQTPMLSRIHRHFLTCLRKSELTIAQCEGLHLSYLKKNEERITGTLLLRKRDSASLASSLCGGLCFLSF